MSILTADQKATLLARLDQSDTVNLSAAAAAAVLSARTMVANPSPQGTAPRPFDFAAVMGCLSDASIAAVRDTPNTTDLIDKINAGDAIGIAHWVAALTKSPVRITAAEAGAVMAVIQATEPDPAWPAQVAQPSWAEANFGGVPFTQPDGSILTDQISAAMCAEARS